MALAVPTTLDRDREHQARNHPVMARPRNQAVVPAATDLPAEPGIPPETRMLAFVMVYMLAVSLGVGALLVRLW